MPRFYPGYRWGTKPPPGTQLDLEQEINVGVQEYYPFNEWSGKLAQNIGPSGAGPFTSSAALWKPATSPSSGGLAVGASGPQTCFTPNAVNAGTQNSFVLYFARTAVAVANGILLVVRSSNASVNSQINMQYDGTAANLSLGLWNSSGVAQTATIPAANIVTNAVCRLVGSFDRATGNINAWLNGAAFTHAGTGAVTGTPTTGYSLALGASVGGGALQAHTIFHLAHYSRLLTAADDTILAADPWAPLLVPALRRYWVVSANNAFAQTLAATQGTTPIMARGTGKLIAASQGSTPTLLKGIGHTLTATQGNTPTMAKGRAANMAATQASTPTLIRGTGKTITATQASTPLLTRGTGKVLSATQGTTATILALKTKIVTLAATQGTTATMGRSVGKVLAAVQAATVTLQRGIGHSLSATQGATAALSKGRAATLATSQGASASMIRGTGKRLPATQAVTAQMQRAIGKTMAAVQASTVTLSRGMARTLAATQGSSATMARGVSKVLTATQAQTVTLLASRAGGLPVLIARATMTMVGVPTATMRLLLAPTATMTMEES